MRLSMLLIALLAGMGLSSVKSPMSNNLITKYSDVASTWFVEATPLVVGSSDVPLTEQDMINAITSPVPGLTLAITYDTYKRTTRIGTYTYTVRATDGVTTKSVTNTITVKDNTKPFSTSITPLSVANNTTLSDSALINAIEVQDNSMLTYDETLDEDGSLSTSIYSNDYNQTKTCGIYYYSVVATDGSGNQIIINNSVEVYDATNPIIAGPSQIKTGHILSKQEIMALFTFTDETSTEDNISIDYTDKSKNTPGTYTLTLTATDEAGNKATKSVSIQMINDKSSLMYISNKVYVASTNIISSNDVNYIVANYLGLSTKDKINYSSSYFETPSTPGEYVLNVSIANQIYKVPIVVFEQAKVKKDNWFIKMLKSIGKFFKWIYKHILTPIGHFFRAIFRWVIGLF